MNPVYDAMTDWVDSKFTQEELNRCGTIGLTTILCKRGKPSVWDTFVWDKRLWKVHSHWVRLKRVGYR